MRRRGRDGFETIRSEGGLLPPDLLRRVLDPDSGLPGTDPASYGLGRGERINEEITAAWNRLTARWREFREARAGLAEGEAGTGLTNETWTLPLLRTLGFGRLPVETAPAVGGRTWPIRRFFGPVPIHLVGCGVSLDRRAAGVRGAAAGNPHGIVQEFLDRSEGHLWGIVSNGLRLRILRDSHSLSRQAYLEFDLEAMFEGEEYSDFVVLWLVAHASRFEPREEGRPETCWLEAWTREAEEMGTRALGDLRAGVERALQVLGEGFVGHPRNTELRDRLRSGELPVTELHAQLLRVVYRLIFLFVAEDRQVEGRPLLHPPDDSEEARRARERYSRWYGTRCLRDLAGRIRGTLHGDLWHQFRLVILALSGDEAGAAARHRLALPALGGFLWSPASTPDLFDAELSNQDFLEVIRHLAWVRQGNVLRAVDYRHLGAEELGGVYESLLGLTPRISGDGARFTFAELGGNLRRTSGSYYTPDSLVQALLDSALEPVIEEAIAGRAPDEAERALLDLRVCDPAVGSGHFLVGAAHRLARHLARIRARARGEGEPSPLLYRGALRDVISRCLYGVDINPMAAELCRVGLWLEALEPGRPLAFLDHHVRVGNSLLGTTPERVAEGLPDDAFKKIRGDDPATCRALRRANRAERAGQGALFAEGTGRLVAGLAEEARAVEARPDASLEDVREKAAAFERLVVSPEYRHAQRLLDAWCPAFVWPKRPDAPPAITTGTLRRLAEDPGALAPDQAAELDRLAREYRFFHWPLAFPEVFARGGFDCVLGNPPWERVKLQEREWFATRAPEIARAPTAAERRRRIRELAQTDPILYAEYEAAVRRAEATSHFLRHSGEYPLCGGGDINYYAVFAELMRRVLAPRGRMGAVLPTGIVTDDTTKDFFRALVESRSLVSVFDFENKGFFPDVDSRMKFCLLTAGSGIEPLAETADYVFFAHDVADLQDPERRFTLTTDDILLLNPNTGTCPVFRGKRDAVLVRAMYRRHPVLMRTAEEGGSEENPWGIQFLRMFDMTNDSGLFRTREQLEAAGGRLVGNRFLVGAEAYFPLYEGKMVQPFNHRAADVITSPSANQRRSQPQRIGVEELRDPSRIAMPLYWVRDVECAHRIPMEWRRSWLVGFSNITSPTNQRTMTPAMVPLSAVGNNLPLILSGAHDGELWLLYASFTSFAFDYCVRQKIGGVTMNFFIVQQVVVPTAERLATSCPWSSGDAWGTWVRSRVLELTYTAWDMEAFARDLGFEGPPFRWDEERRSLLRCELDAAFFHLYLPSTPEGRWRLARVAEGAVRDETPGELAELERVFPRPRDAVVHVLDMFGIIREEEERSHGEFRTKRVILEIYDAMQEAMATGRPYRTVLDPPPAHPSLCLPDTPPPWVEVYREVGRRLRERVASGEGTSPRRASRRRGTRRRPSGEETASPGLFDAPAGAENAESRQGRRRGRPRRDDLLERALEWLREHPGEWARADLVGALGIAPGEWAALAAKLARHPQVERTGQRRGTRYRYRPS